VSSLNGHSGSPITIYTSFPIHERLSKVCNSMTLLSRSLCL